MRDSLDDGERAETPLDHYFSTIKPSNDDDQDQDHGKERTRRRRRPHPKQLTLTEATRQARGASSSKSTIEQNRSLNKAIRQTLGKDDNPVTNSSAYGRTLHVQSCSTGHQGGGGGGGRKWSLHRNAKLAIQAADRVTRTLEGVVAYISGYTGEEHTNLELRACVERQGGKCLTAFSTSSKVCTHVFSTTQLSGSKQQKYIESNRKNKFKIVLPRWAFECERSGKRLAEANFVAPIKHQLQSSVFEIYKSTVPHVNASTTREENDLDCQLVDDSSLSTTTSKGKGRAEEEGVLILSPSPLRNATSQDLDVKALEHDRDESTLSSKRRKTNGVDDQERGKQRRGRRLIEKENSIEELLIVGSSDVEPEFASAGGGPVHRRQTPRRGGGGGGRRAERGGSETEELDEFGMPPSGQRRR